MEMPPSVSALAGMHGDTSRCLLLIGVQPQEIKDFGGGLRPEVKRRIEPVSGSCPTAWLAGAFPPFNAWRRGKRR